MGHIAIFVDIGSKPCLVIGGGEVAHRKVESLLEAGAEVTVISPELGGELGAMAKNGAIRHFARRYRRGDLKGFTLVYAATDDAPIQREVAAEAGKLGIALNVADAPELCTFFAPAAIRRGDLQIAISTGGASPALAARIREELEPQFGPEYALALEILRAVRMRLMAVEPDAGEHGRKLRALAASRMRECLRRGDYTAIEAILAEHLGCGITLSELGFDGTRLDSGSGARINGTR